MEIHRDVTGRSRILICGITPRRPDPPAHLPAPCGLRSNTDRVSPGAARAERHLSVARPGWAWYTRRGHRSRRWVGVEPWCAALRLCRCRAGSRPHRGANEPLQRLGRRRRRLHLCPSRAAREAGRRQSQPGDAVRTARWHAGPVRHYGRAVGSGRIIVAARGTRFELRLVGSLHGEATVARGDSG